MAKLNIRVKEDLGDYIAEEALLQQRSPSDVVRRILTGLTPPLPPSRNGRKVPRKGKATRKAKKTQ